MLKVGLTGGLGSGKSFVGAELHRLGCYLIEADRLGHEVLSPGGAAFEPVVKLFGREILDATGAIDRKHLAQIVFADEKKLAALNAIVHPAVWERERALTKEIAANDPKSIVIIEAAILIETGSYRNCDRLIVVVCDERLQIERALLRPGATRADVEQRIARQMPISAKRNFADYVIDSSGTRDDTLRQTAAVYSSLQQLLRE